MKYKIVAMTDDVPYCETQRNYAGIEAEKAKTLFIDAAFDMGFHFSGYHHNPNTRSELQGQPKFRNLLGPMWDGNGVIRYETPQAYKTLST